MKRKIALLLAAAMTLSMLPMTVFAASDNRISNSVSVVPKQTLLWETDMASGFTGSSNLSDISYMQSGSNLVITLKDPLVVGATMRLSLTTAKWMFRSSNNDLATGSGIAVTGLNAVGAGQFNNTMDTEHWGLPASTNGMVSTYDQNLGVFIPTSNTSTTGDYYRLSKPDASTGYEVPYKLSISAAGDSVATLEVLPYDGFSTAKKAATATTPATAASNYVTSTATPYQIVVPLVCRTTDTADVKVTITNGTNSSVSTGTWLYGVGSDTLTTATVDDPKTARDDFPLNILNIQESRIGSIINGSFDITAPNGFTFNDPNYASTNGNMPTLGVEYGLKWLDTNAAGNGVSGTNYTMKFKTDSSEDDGFDHSVIRVTLINVVPSTTISGSVYINDLDLIPDDNAPFGDIMLKLTNVRSDTTVVTAQNNILAGTRVDWTVSMTTETDIPTLVNGRLDPANDMSNATDQYHQTAKIDFKENAVNSWWGRRTTTFTLPDGVVFRKVEITDVDNVDDPDSTNLKQVFTNTGKRVSNVLIDGNTMTWTNIHNSSTDAAEIQFDMWVSIQSGFQGDVTLTCGGSGITDADKMPAIVVAHQMSPVTVTTAVSDLKIGYQYQSTADVQITETAAGNLLKGKWVNISVTDMISSDMAFTPDTKIAITSGDMSIKNISTNGNGNASTVSGASLGTTGGTLTFQVDQPSTKASTITLSNVSLKIDRTVPVTNYQPYNIVVWGTAIAENYGSNRDMFQVPGIEAPYVSVVTSADNSSSLLSQEVRVTIGESYYTVNGTTFDMDAAAYISPASNSTMVPIRFVANAFGISDDSIAWDNDTKTVTLVTPQRIVQFSGNKSTMLLNGATVNMYSPDGLVVKAEIQGDAGHERMYIPFRALGNAFGVPVAWDASTNTAIYNQGANTNKTSAVTTTGAATTTAVAGTVAQ